MNYFSLIMLMLNIAFMADISTAQETAESIMKKSVDFDAPVINSEEVLGMLKQLQTLVPKDNSPVQFDIENLISFSVMSPEKCTTKFDEQKQWLREPNNVSSPNRDKLWGPNIMAYFTYYKVKSFEYCTEELKKNVVKVNGDDLKKVQAIAKHMRPEGFKSLNDLNSLNSIQIFEGVRKYLEATDKNFDKDMQKAKTREDAHKRYEKDLPIVCDRVVENIQPVVFIGKAKVEEDFPKNLFDNPFLAEWMANWRICLAVRSTKMKDFDPYYFGDKGVPVEKVPFWKNVATLGGASGGSGGPGGISMTSFAVATM